MSKLQATLNAWRKTAQDLTYNDASNYRSWKAVFLESMFAPPYPSMPHKGPMDMLHPDIKKLHLPHGVYIADWRKYRVEDHLALVRFQERCHKAGLHDPWLRNECHQFYENTGGGNQSNFALIFFQSSYGLAMAVAAFIVQNIYSKYFPPKMEHTQEYIDKWGPEGRPRHH